MPKHQTTRPRRKSLYRVKNWPEYERALVQRGTITVWLSENFQQGWLYTGEKQRGSQLEYSEQAIASMLTIQEVFHLTQRGAEGFVRSLFAWLGVALPVPDHTTLSKRSHHLRVSLPRRAKGSLHLVLDGTGLKVFGEGEWKVCKHGYSKHRAWRKLPIGLEPDSGEIQAVALTTNGHTDGQVAPALLAQIEQPLLSCSGDGAYDKRPVYQALRQHSPQAQVAIPPQHHARIWQHGNSKADRLVRDENVRYIRRHGRPQWKQVVGYHRRSLVETSMFRLKTIFGDKLSTRLLETQVTQAWIRCAALHRMTHLGMPDSQRLA
jgi:hypothetical protein